MASKFDNRLKEFGERWEVDRYLSAAGYLAANVKPFFVALPKVPPPSAMRHAVGPEQHLAEEFTSMQASSRICTMPCGAGASLRNSLHAPRTGSQTA